MPFVISDAAVPVVNPQTQTLFRRAPYISPSEYINAPTAVDIDDLLPGGETTDQTASLANTIWRASGWLDTICFHTADGTLAASQATQTAAVKPKRDGSLPLACKYRPILELDEVLLGVAPGQLATVDQDTLNSAWFETSVIWLSQWSYPQPNGYGPTFGYPVARGGRVFAQWTYVNGFPHTYLADAVEAGAAAITVAPSLPAGSAVYGVYPGTQLTIHDGTETEVIVVESVNGLTLNLTGPLLYAHTPPDVPDSIRVTAIPWDVEQACISLTSALIKTRGTEAMVLPDMPGQTPHTTVLSQAGGLEDFVTAYDMLTPYRTVVS